MQKPIEDFLDRATEGLRDDEELRRETRAELATHAEAKLRELTDAGKAGDEAVDETMKALGESLEIAGELHEANRGRMNRRAKVRLFLRFALVPAAVLAAIWASDWPAPWQSLGGFLAVASDNWDTGRLAPSRTLTGQERLILYGDPSRTNRVEQQKAIWESDPTNRVYFGNYFVEALSVAGGATKLDPELIEQARAFEPDNAMYCYLEASCVLGSLDIPRPPSLDRSMVGQAGEEAPDGTAYPEEALRGYDGAMILHEVKREEDQPPAPPAYQVVDRARLDRAMALFEESLTMPRFEKYQMDMLAERLAILGEPERMVELIHRISLSVGVLLPSLRYQMKLSRAAVAYGDLLLQEGDQERAAVFLNSWEALSRQLLQEADTLIEVLVAGAVIEKGGAAAGAYRRAGMDQEADRMAARVAAASRPLREWKTARTEGSNAVEEAVEQRGSVLAAALLPALGESLPQGALEASRRLEYTVATEALVGAVIVLLFVSMAGCLAVALRWRFAGRGRAIPLLLIPRWHDLARILGLGILLPGAVFLVVTRGLPFSGHAYSIRFGSHKLIAEFGLLILAFSCVPAWLSARVVTRRCVELWVPVVRPATRLGKWAIIASAIILAVAWCIPAQDEEAPKIIAGIGAGLGGCGLILAGLSAWLHGLFAHPGHGLFFGTLFRSLIPALAAAVVALSLLSRPVLLTSEAAYIRQDTVMASSEVGFTSVEERVTDRLRGEMLAVLEGLKAGR